MTNVKLDRTTSGGDLPLLEVRHPNPRHVRIDTRPGETADAVLVRIADAAIRNRPSNPYREWPIRDEGNLLKSFPGSPGDDRPDETGSVLS